jgi:hypothetical protein
LNARFILAAFGTAMLCACGSADKPPVQDETLARTLSAARTAYLQGQSELAVGLYREARERARARDDQAAIAKIAYDLGAAELQKGDPEAALATARAAREEMERRQMQGTAPLRLVEAVALYRLGQSRDAAGVAHLIVEDGQADAVLRARAIFVGGLIAAEAGDLATVERSLSQLSAADQQPELATDRIELAGWRALLAGEPRQAQQEFLAAADGRRRALDYRGMGRALAAAGEAATRDGNVADATDLFLRAGRSAMIRGESANARRWLGRAESLALRARKPEMLSQARALIHKIAD